MKITWLTKKLLLVVLRPYGYWLITAQDGEEAVAVTIREHPDLILMDLQLPKMSGYTATQLIKQEPTTNHIPVVALTAHAMPEEKKNAFAIGFDGYITKPINTRTFHDEIKQYLERKRLE